MNPQSFLWCCLCLQLLVSLTLECHGGSRLSQLNFKSPWEVMCKGFKPNSHTTNLFKQGRDFGPTDSNKSWSDMNLVPQILNHTLYLLATACPFLFLCKYLILLLHTHAHIHIIIFIPLIGVFIPLKLEFCGNFEVLE